MKDTSLQPLVITRTVSISPPTDSDRRAHDQRLRAALGMPGLRIPLRVLRNTENALRAGGDLPVVVARAGRHHRLVATGRGSSFSVALDIGTTNLVAALYDNIARREVLTLSTENPQIRFGSDILTRLHHALSGRSDELVRVLRDGVNGLLASLCSSAHADPAGVHALAVAGNTVMTHFFLGLDVSTIPVAPFTPVVRAPGFFHADELGIGISPAAAVYAFPNAGSYVGGDIVAGIIASGMQRSAGISLLVDVGTNAEVVIGNRDWMIVGAGAAGPALEEGIARAGKRAKSGIVYDVAIEGGTVRCRTFDDRPAEGICGSGMISLVHELFRAGIIDQTGTLRDHPSVDEAHGERAFVLSCGGEGLSVTQTELRNFLRSKAAMFTLLLTLTRSVGVSFSDVERVFVSGALGTGIDARKAAAIGMMPGWPADAVQALGNTSLAGCRLLLADADIAAEADALVDRITYKHMHDDPEFMKEFRGAMFIPHTEPGLLKA